jgi:hypothetical protein
MNIEYRMSNIECRRKEFYRFLLIQKTERSDTINLQSSIVNAGFAGLGPYRFVPFAVSIIFFIAARYS